MKTKEKVAQLLQQAASEEGVEIGGKTVREGLSGEAIGEALGISRTAVWKAIQSLIKEGYAIEAKPGAGYRLREDNDVLSVTGIEAAIRANGGAAFVPGLPKTLDEEGQIALEWPKIYDEVTSTNDLVMEAARAGEPEGYTVIARFQTKGRGRKGRAFFSPEDTGLYFTVLLRPDLANFDPGHITITAAVAVAKALEDCGIDGVGIKWVNDVFVKGKKVCGILTEGVQDLETGGIDFAVLGIGVNVYEPKDGFPEEIKDTAAAVLGKTRQRDTRNRLFAGIYTNFFSLYRGEEKSTGGRSKDAGGFATVMEEYRKRCIVPGRKIKVIKGASERPATALSLDDTCGLLVEYEDGSREVLTAGEISLKLQ